MCLVPYGVAVLAFNSCRPTGPRRRPACPAPAERSPPSCRSEVKRVQFEGVRLDGHGLQAPEGGGGPRREEAQQLFTDRGRQGGEARAGPMAGEEVVRGAARLPAGRDEMGLTTGVGS